MIYRFLPFWPKADFKVKDDCNCMHVMYGYVFWNNTYEGVWYAVNREHMAAFFAGGEDRKRLALIDSAYYVGTDILDVIKKILDANEK